MRVDAGFTLLELMIAVVVVAILAAVAYGYQSYVGRGYRAEAHTARIGSRIFEQYYLDRRQYAADLTGEADSPAVTEGGRYRWQWR